MAGQTLFSSDEVASNDAVSIDISSDAAKGGPNGIVRVIAMGGKFAQLIEVLRASKQRV